MVWYGIPELLLSIYNLTLTNHPINNTQLQLFSYDNRYVDGGVHASDGGRCHPSIRGDIYNLLPLSVCVFLCVTYLFYCIVLLCQHTNPALRTPT